MYCSQCGAKAEGNFCSSCGAPLAGRASAAPSGADVLAQAPAAAPFDLATADLTAVARAPQARELVARHAAQSRQRVSGEEFLQAFDTPLKAVGAIPVSSLMTIAQPIYTRLGIRTGKERVATIDRPIQETFLALLCTLARNGQLVRALHTATDGCVVEAVLPSDMRSFEGTIVVTLRRADGGTEVRASTAIKGQLFDWGKSSACLDTLLTDVRTIPVMI